jgi:DNA-binding NtrC family response regulator
MPAPDLDESLLDFLRGYTFPGNVRELEHTMEKMVALSDGEPLGIADLPPSVRRSRPGVSAENAVRRGAVQAGAAPADGSFEDSLGGAVHAVPGRLAAAAGVGPEERAIGPDGPTNKATDGAADGAANGATDGSADGARGRGRAGEEATAGDATDRADRFGTLASGPPGAGGGASPEDLLARGPISLFDVERRLLEEAIRRSGGNLSEAARRLGISYKTMRYRARKFDLDE